MFFKLNILLGKYKFIDKLYIKNETKSKLQKNHGYFEYDSKQGNVLFQLQVNETGIENVRFVEVILKFIKCNVIY